MMDFTSILIECLAVALLGACGYYLARIDGRMERLVQRQDEHERDPDAHGVSKVAELLSLTSASLDRISERQIDHGERLATVEGIIGSRRRRKVKEKADV